MRRIVVVIVLWALAVVGVVGNVIASVDDMGTLVRLGFGIVAVLGIAALVVLYVRNKRARQRSARFE